MRLRLKSFNGFTLNVTGQYSAKSTIEDYGLFSAPTTEEILIPRAGAFPSLAGVLFKEKVFTISVTLLGAYVTQVDDLKAAFDPRLGEKTLVLTDEDTSTDYFILAACLGQPVIGNVCRFDMLAANPILQSVNAIPDTWNITASGQTRAVTISGKIEARPVFDITAGAKGLGYSYRKSPTLYPPDDRHYGNYPLLLTPTWDVTAIVSDSSRSNQVNSGSGITAAATTIPVDTAVGGGLPATGGMGIFVDNGEQIYYTALSGGNLTGVVRGIGGTTATTHADNAVIRWSKMQANGADCRIFDGAEERPRWVSGANSAAMKVWSFVNWKGKEEFALATALASSGAVTSVSVRAGTGVKSALQALPAAGVILIDSEKFFYSAVDPDKLTLTIESRAANGTSMAAHAAGAIVRWLQAGNFWTVWGNGAVTLDQDNSAEPVLNLANSTNTSWDFDIFTDLANMRAAHWLRDIVSSTRKSSFVYTGSHGDETTDPAQVMGMAIFPAQVSGKYLGDTAALTWTFFHPGGITHIAAAGEKYRGAAFWPDVIGIQKSNDGKTWAWVRSEPKPATAATWEAWSIAATSLGGSYKYVRFITKGSGPGVSGSGCYYEVTDVTLTLDSTHTPVVTDGAAAGNYHMDGVLTNVTTGAWMRIAATLAAGQILTVDCDRKRVTLSDGSEPMAAPELDDESREDWFPMPPGSNTLRWDEAGVTSMTIVTSHKARYL